jgi:hypothetical protein
MFTRIRNTYTCLHISTPIYIHMFTFLYAPIRSKQIYIHLRSYKHYKSHIILCPHKTKICLEYFYTDVCRKFITYFCAHIRRINVYILHRSYTYTWLIICAPIYLYSFICFYALIPILVYIHLRPYTHHTCLHTSTLAHLYIFKYYYTRIPASVHIHLYPHTEAYFYTFIPAYQCMSTYFCTRIPMHVYIHLRLLIYAYLDISTPVYLCMFTDFYTSISMPQSIFT